MIPAAALLLAALSTQELRIDFPLGEPPAPAGRSVTWLQASEGLTVDLARLVSAWEDEDHAAAWVQNSGLSQPHADLVGLRGLPALHFDGNDALARASGMPLGDSTLVIVVSLDTDAVGGKLVSGAAGGHALALWPNGLVELSHAGVVFVSGTLPGSVAEVWTIVSTFDADTGRGELFANGVSIGSGMAALPNNDASVVLGEVIGTGAFAGHVAELLIYDRVLAPQERWLTRRYITAKFFSHDVPTVAFSRLPRDGQLIARPGREPGTTGEVRVAGSVALRPGGGPYEAVEVELLRDGVCVSHVTEDLVVEFGAGPSGGWGATFDLSVDIMPGLHDHSLNVYLLQFGTLVRIDAARRTNLTCGDVYLIHGQSNAFGPDLVEEGLAELDESHWIRSFSTSGRDLMRHDMHWSQADGVTSNDHGTIGQWAVRFARRIFEQEQVPIAVLNGGQGATSITDHLADPGDSANPATLYGRLLQRTIDADVLSEAAALIWYHGEFDGPDPSIYPSNFAALRASWLQDYPGLTNIYAFQVRQGCGFLGPGVRELQRNFAAIYPDVQVMSTTAAMPHDGCHFSYAGYAEIGERLARLVRRDFYGANDSQEIEAPNLEQAELIAPAIIRLTFHDLGASLTFEPGAELDFVLDDPAVTVVSGTAQGRTVVLQLSGATSATTISYVGHVGDLPSVFNSRGVGVLTFFDQPLPK